MSNPVLTDKAFDRAETNPGWGAPTGPAHQVPRRSAHMTIGGTLSATGVLFVVFLAAATFGWLQVEPVDDLPGATGPIPGWLLFASLTGFVLAIACSFFPKAARIIGPLYALLQGAVVGAISHVYEIRYPGIVLSAVGATVAVFATMLALYATRIIKVTQRFRAIVVSMTLGLMVFYLVAFGLTLFGVDVPVINDATPLGIAFSVFAAGLAAFNLLLDFDFMERHANERTPKYMEWYAGFGLLVTIVWLYLELLRLLGKLRR